MLEFLLCTLKTVLNVHVGVPLMYIKDCLKRTCWEFFHVSVRTCDVRRREYVRGACSGFLCDVEFYR